MSLAFWHEKMADPYRETDSSGTTGSFVPYLRDTILPDRAKHRNDTPLPISPSPTSLIFQQRVNINLPGGGYVGVAS